MEDDDVVDEVVNVTVAVDDAGSDDDFDPVADQTVIAAVVDNDSAGFTLSPGAAVGLGESSTATFTAVLDAQPTSDVTLLASSSDTGAAVVAPATLTFTTANWNTPQTVTVTGVADDDVVDEVVNVTVAVDDPTSDDDFDPVADQTLTATVTDDDSPGFTLSQTTATLTEGTTTTFTATLDAQPTTNVVIDVTSADVGALSASPAALTFTSRQLEHPPDDHPQRCRRR